MEVGWEEDVLSKDHPGSRTYFPRTSFIMMTLLMIEKDSIDVFGGKEEEVGHIAARLFFFLYRGFNPSTNGAGCILSLGGY